MSSLRGSPPPRAPKLACPLLAPVARPCVGLGLALSLGACSSAAPLEANGGSATDGETLGAGTSTGWGADEGTGTGGGPTTGADPGGSTEAGTGESPGTGAGDPPAPPELPGPVDQIDPQNFAGESACAAEQAVVWRLGAHDVDAMASPTLAREAVLGPWPSLMGVAIHPWEFLNYYTFGYPLAPPGQLLAAAQMRAREDELGEVFELQVAVRGPSLSEAERPPVHLTLALDNSGSMVGKPLELLKMTCHALASRLRAGDTVAAVSWNQADAVLLPVTKVSGPNDAALLATCDNFAVGGAAELKDALSAGYALADQAYVPEDINRLVIISDGGATATEEDVAEMAKRAGDAPHEPGVHTIGIGVGDPALYRRELIDVIGDAGAGPSIYVGNAAQAETQVGQRFLSLVGLAASSVEVRLSVPPGLELEQAAPPHGAEFVGPATVTAAPVDRSVFHRRLRPCGPEVDLDGVLRVDIDWVDALTGEKKHTSSEWKLEALLAGESAWLDKGEAVLAYAAALRSIQHVSDLAAVERAWARLQAAKSALPDDPELAEIGEVLAALQEP